jgi:hypothetical protein
MMIFTLIFASIYLYFGISTSFALYGGCLLMGIGNGYWAMFVTIGAEQFGTNLRATAATTVPNMVRGMVVGMTTLYGFLKPTLGVINAGSVVGIICFAIGFWAIITIDETHDRDLDFLEE